MSNEDLLKPRYKVIADYPGNNRTEGEIIPSKFENFTQDEVDALLFTCKQFPKVFKMLEWWEERTIEDLPDYAKYQKLIYKATDKFIASVRCEKHPSDGIGLDADWGSCLPATEAEYLSALAQLEAAKGSS